MIANMTGQVFASASTWGSTRRSFALTPLDSGDGGFATPLPPAAFVLIALLSLSHLLE